MPATTSRYAKTLAHAGPRTHRLPFPFRSAGRLALAAMASIGLTLGCTDGAGPDDGDGSDDGNGPGMILSVSVSPSDTTVFVGKWASIQASVEYETGPGTPDSVVWSVSDPAVLSLDLASGAAARATGLARGSAYVIATIEESWVDSAAVEVVQAGDVRWVAEVGLSQRNHTALDGLGRIHVLSSDGPGPLLHGMLNVFRPDGSRIFAEPTCFSFYGPTLREDGTAYTTGIDCSMAHEVDGSVKWTLPFGGVEGAFAVAADGSAALLHNENADTAGFTVLSWITPAGDEAWRDTLGVTGIGLIQENPVAIAADGDIYVPWQESYAPVSVKLSRVAPDGTTRWTVPLTGGNLNGLEGQTPAPLGDRVAVSFDGGGLAVYDTSGALLWDAATGATCSSPVVDGAGNIFVQTRDGLLSYEPAGALRWSADSLAAGGCFPAPPPTLLEGNQLVVPCGSREVCAVDASDGSLVWRSATGGFARCSSPAVGPDGTIYIPFSISGESRLVALWNDAPPLQQGWPTEGGDMGRTRSR